MPFDIPELKALSEEQQELLLDIGQMILDVIGIFEPTPFADSTSATISIYRGQWVNAGLSGISVVPYLGDSVKFSKFSKYLETVNKAVAVASKDIRFEKVLRPVFGKLYSALDRIPMHMVPWGMRRTLEELREKTGQFLPGVIKTNARLEKLTDEMLRLIFGSSKNVGHLPRQNVQTIVKFFDRHNVAKGNLEKWRELIKGIDLHAIEPVSIETFQRGDVVAQYVQKAVARKGPSAGTHSEYEIGQWIVKVQGAVSANQLGVSGAGRTHKLYRVRREIEVLKSKAAGAADHWTRSGPKPHTAVVKENGQYVMKDALQVAGKGDQYFMPEAWLYLDEVR